jgi:hypothetical protein
MRFLKRFDGKVEAMVDPTSGVSLEDYVQVVSDEIGINIEISKGLGM